MIYFYIFTFYVFNFSISSLVRLVTLIIVSISIFWDISDFAMLILSCFKILEKIFQI